MTSSLCWASQSSRGSANSPLFEAGAVLAAIVHSQWFRYCRTVIVSSSVRQVMREIDDGGADLVRALLLGPVTAAGQHLDVAQARDKLLEIFEMFGGAGGGEHHVVITGNIERRYRHLQVRESRQKLLVASVVAILVEGA